MKKDVKVAGEVLGYYEGVGGGNKEYMWPYCIAFLSEITMNERKKEDGLSL